MNGMVPETGKLSPELLAIVESAAREAIGLAVACGQADATVVTYARPCPEGQPRELWDFCCDMCNDYHPEGLHLHASQVLPGVVVCYGLCDTCFVLNVEVLA